MSKDFEEKTHEVESKVKCKDCGALLKYHPGQMSLNCEYCGCHNEMTEQIKTVQTTEIDFNEFLAKAAASADTISMTVVKCGSCGASATLKPNVTADSCAFCGTALVVKSGTTSNIIAPKYLLPFSIEMQKGVELFKGWLKGLWFAPNDLKHAVQNDKLKGVYLPYWTYDTNTQSSYSGMRGDHYYVTERYTENGKTQTRSVRKTRWTSAGGSVNDKFDDVLILASNSLPDKYANKLEPWDLHNLAGFNEQFLSGFIAEQYQIDVKGGFEKAKVRMDPVIRQTVRRDIGGDEQQILWLDVQYNDITFKHILLPIWLSAFKYKDKVYRFMINGRTGEVQGERPYSFWKIFFTVLVGVAVIAGLVYFVNEN